MKEEKNLRRIFINHIVGGIGWVFGITIGLAIIGLTLTRAVGFAGGLPVVGEFIAEVIVVTQSALIKSTK